MKTLLTILFIGVISVKGQSLDSVTMINKYGYVTFTPAEYRTLNLDSIDFPHYDTLPKFDTIKVRIMYEQGESVVPIIIRGYQVRRFLKWDTGDERFKPFSTPEPDKWIDTDIFLFEDKTRIDNNRKWGSKQRSW